jgi:hypothetical protein
VHPPDHQIEIAVRSKMAEKCRAASSQATTMGPPLDPWGWGCPQRTTPPSQPPSGFVTITHPHHPLRGQRVEIVRLRRGIDPDLIVRLPDGRHAAIALTGTDYAAPPNGDPPPRSNHLLDLNGLRQVLQLLERMTHDSRCAPGPDLHTPSSPLDSR